MSGPTTSLDDVAERVWVAVGGDASAPSPTISGARRVLPSCFDVTGFAAGAVAAAARAVAEVVAVRTGRPAPSVTVATREAAAAFACEQLFAPVGWSLPAIWDPIAGDYETADGWIRLHTNYAAHKTAALVALGMEGKVRRAAVASAVKGRTADELEQAVVDKGGCAAALRTREAWLAHPHGAATAEEPPVRTATLAGATRALPPIGDGAGGALAGIRVLDLTRVIAGPVCTRYLAAHGAEVLRLDPPGFAEVPALVPETTAGKRTAWLDLTRPKRRERFAALVAQADVVVHGYRPGAMEALGLGPDALRALNPAVVTARLDAYGWTGPWAGRRGFDSLVQMSCGIAAAGMTAAGADRPTPLPVQALDHGAGHLLAAAVLLALARGRAADVTASLAGVANLVWTLPDADGLDVPAPAWGPADRVERDTEWGLATAVPIPGSIAGWPAVLDGPAGPLGRHRPEFVSSV